jgi:hypothetical protein
LALLSPVAEALQSTASGEPTQVTKLTEAPEEVQQQPAEADVDSAQLKRLQELGVDASANALNVDAPAFCPGGVPPANATEAELAAGLRASAAEFVPLGPPALKEVLPPAVPEVLPPPAAGLAEAELPPPLRGMRTLPVPPPVGNEVRASPTLFELRP